MDEDPLKQIRSWISQNGFAIAESDHCTYTVGFAEKHDHPEILFTAPVHYKYVALVLTGIKLNIEIGEVYRPGDIIHNFLPSGLPIAFYACPVSSLYTPLADEYYSDFNSLSMLQLVLPTREGTFPETCSHGQEILGVLPSQRQERQTIISLNQIESRFIDPNLN